MSLRQPPDASPRHRRPGGEIRNGNFDLPKYRGPAVGKYVVRVRLGTSDKQLGAAKSKSAREPKMQRSPAEALQQKITIIDDGEPRSLKFTKAK